MTDKEVMQMALETLEQITPDWRTSIDKSKQLNNSIETLRTALTQPKQYDQTELALCKKCGWKAVWPDGCLVCEKQEAQPEKEWVGLTDEDISGCINSTTSLVKGQFLVEFSKSIETKLKEKNT